ncbi:hypothetical protein [Celeribacter sp. PS-C1]|uniref:hypothetical protein n=1 Tax=Celeribacter sp. PS-C1 TaxID=2820813 RepID=UPI001CA501EE|nr:hypothetical protein [Celeribacter sp. PS-C1]MBW6419082.1 hypothetical protein [Celeribacter sp. PS-C1]
MKRILSHALQHRLATLSITTALALAPALAGAQSMLTDGRTGPVEMNGHALDHAMMALNDFVSAKQAQSDIMDTLDMPPNDFAEVALASGTHPLAQEEATRSSFGWPISGGASLDTHLVAFNQDLAERGDDLFLRIAAAEASSNLDFGTVASDVAHSAYDAGRIHDDRTLNDEMVALRDGMREFDDRLSRLSRSVPEVTGTSFERYVESLSLF